jgi:hypothetical protein
MTATISANADGPFSASFRFVHGNSMLESEEALRAALYEAGNLATGKCLEHFDTDGAPIVVGGERLTSKGRLPKVYQTPYGEMELHRHVYRLPDPGSEWRLHREWFERAALGDLLGEDCRLVADDTLYLCLDKLLPHKDELFSFLTDRWRDLFNARFDVLLYDLTSTYFECDAPEPGGLRRFGYSRDKRSDCVQIVIALILTPEGLPLGYEVLTDNTADKATLAGMLEKIEKSRSRGSKAQRIWLMDRGIPTEEVLENMRKSDPPVQYLVGAPKGALNKLEQSLAQEPWQQARQGIEVKLVEKDQEVYVLAKSESRISKERAMRKRRLKKLWKRLGVLQKQQNTYENLMLKLGAAKAEAGRCWGLVKLRSSTCRSPDSPRQRRKQTRRKIPLRRGSLADPKRSAKTRREEE